MSMNAESVIDKIIPVFLGSDLESINITVPSIETAIKDNHEEIVKWLESTGKIDDDVLAELKKELDI